MTIYEEQLLRDIHRIASFLNNSIEDEVKSKLISRNKRNIDDISRITLPTDILERLGKRVIVDEYEDKIIIRKCED